MIETAAAFSALFVPLMLKWADLLYVWTYRTFSHPVTDKDLESDEAY